MRVAAREGVHDLDGELLALGREHLREDAGHDASHAVARRAGDDELRAGRPDDERAVDVAGVDGRPGRVLAVVRGDVEGPAAGKCREYLRVDVHDANRDVVRRRALDGGADQADQGH